MNWPAYAALGRVWVEKSQDAGSKEIAREYLLMANIYLKTAIDGIRKTGKLDQVYFGALYNQIVVLLYLFENDRNKLEKLLLQGYMVKKEALSALSLIQDNMLQRKPDVDIGHDKLWAVGLYKKYEQDLNSENEETLMKAIISLQGNDGLCNDEISKSKDLIYNKKIKPQELKDHAMASWLLDFLQALEFVLQNLDLQINLDSIRRDKNRYPEGVKSWLTEKAIRQFSNLPLFDPLIDMNFPLQLSDKAGFHFTRSHYRVQYNAACFYSQLALMTSTKTEEGKKENALYVDLALDHLEMALSVGGGIELFAQKDSSISGEIRKEKRYKKIIKEKGEERSSHHTSGERGRNRSVYRRKKDGKWVNKRDDARRVTSVHATQKEAIDAAREMLYKQGGGELSIHGEDGKIREKDTIGPGNDPENIKG